MAFAGPIDPALGVGGPLGVGGILGGPGPLGVGGGIGGPLGGIFGSAGPLGGSGGIGGPLGGVFGGLGIPALPFPPYVPVTPLGALEAFKGDLIIPIVIIGVALFILLVIVLAIKAALLWKAELLGVALGHGQNRRSLPDTPPAHDEDHMSTLATVVMSALDNQRCLEKIICSVGTYGQGSSWPQWVSMMEGLVSEDYRQSLSVLKQCAEGTAKAEDFSCGSNSSQNGKQGFQQQEPQQRQQNGQQGLAGQGAKNSTLNSSINNNKNASAKANQSAWNDTSNHL